MTVTISVTHIDEIASSVETPLGNLTKFQGIEDAAAQANLKLAEYRATKLHDEISKIPPVLGEALPDQTVNLAKPLSVCDPVH
jgi:hypothetical protein